jgi:hypothetical protein
LVAPFQPSISLGREVERIHNEDIKADAVVASESTLSSFSFP